jgi:hypothetical protein
LGLSNKYVVLEQSARTAAVSSFQVRRKKEGRQAEDDSGQNPQAWNIFCLIQIQVDV